MLVSSAQLAPQLAVEVASGLPMRTETPLLSLRLARRKLASRHHHYPTPTKELAIELSWCKLVYLIVVAKASRGLISKAPSVHPTVTAM